MNYLQELRNFLQATFLKLDGIPNVIERDEKISRFIVYSKYVDAKNGLVRHAAFAPSTKTRNTSVYRMKGCSESRIWQIGYYFVECLLPDRRPIIARADIACVDVYRQELKIIPKSSPHPRHAEVIDWPDDKATQKFKQIALAQAATLLLRQKKDALPT